MKKCNTVIIILLLLSGLLVPAANAGLFDTSEYDQCLIENLSGTKLDMVAKEIVRICDETYKHNRFISKQRKAYNLCLLQNLKYVESLIAAQEIINACRRIHLE